MQVFRCILHRDDYLQLYFDHWAHASVQAGRMQGNRCVCSEKYKKAQAVFKVRRRYEKI